MLALSLALTATTAPGGGGAIEFRASDAQAATQGSPPNIVVLMTDDLDVVSLQEAVRAGLLPRLRQLFGDGGIQFRESFVSESLCCPSRATFLTGLYPHNHRVVRNSDPNGGFADFMRTYHDNNLATWMRAAGYRTGHVGKFLNGYSDGTVVPAGWDDWQALVDVSTYCMYDYDVSNNGNPVHYGHRPVEDYQTDVLAGLAEGFILDSRARGDLRPLFLSLAPIAPHEERCVDGIRPAPRHYLTPLLPLPRPPSLNEADMSDKPAWMRDLAILDETALAQLYNQRIAALRAVDDMLGRVIGALDGIQELDRTAFVFTSDNGYLLGAHRWEAKILLYEESIRVPLMLRIPGLPGPGSVGEIALNNDLAPTIAALAGAVPGVVTDGRSLLPLLDGTATSWRKRFLAEFPPALPGSSAHHSDVVPPFFAVRCGADGELSQLVYAETMRGATGLVAARELYDLRPTVDPFQLASSHLNPAYFAKQGGLEQHLEALKACRKGTCQALEN